MIARDSVGIRWRPLWPTRGMVVPFVTASPDSVMDVLNDRQLLRTGAVTFTPRPEHYGVAGHGMASYRSIGTSQAAYTCSLGDHSLPVGSYFFVLQQGDTADRNFASFTTGINDGLRFLHYLTYLSATQGGVGGADFTSIVNSTDPVAFVITCDGSDNYVAYHRNLRTGRIISDTGDDSYSISGTPDQFGVLGLEWTASNNYIGSCALFIWWDGETLGEAQANTLLDDPFGIVRPTRTLHFPPQYRYVVPGRR